jgi:hypothetical protein
VTPDENMLVIVPSRGRPRNAYDLMVAFQETGAQADLLFVLDANDPAHQFYPGLNKHILDEQLLLVPKLNFAWGHNADWYKYVAFMGDDHRPRTPGWDARIRAELDDMGSGIVYGNDLLQGEAMATAVFMTNDIPTALGYMCTPAVKHLCCDLIWLDWGRGIDRLRYLDDVVIEHMHPVLGKARQDGTYRLGNNPVREAEDNAGYHHYVANGLEADLEKLRAVIA